jgi:hypothetical protein
VTEDTYIDMPWGVLRWDRDHRCVFAEWKGFVTSFEFQDALLRALEIALKEKASSFVTDTTHLELVSDEDQRWIRYMWAPMAIEAGLKRIAVVVAPHGLSKMAIEGMFAGRRITGAQLDSRTFDSVADALKWVADF